MARTVMAEERIMNIVRLTKTVNTAIERYRQAEQRRRPEVHVSKNMVLERLVLIGMAEEGIQTEPCTDE